MSKENDLAYRIVSRIMSNQERFDMDSWFDAPEDFGQAPKPIPLNACGTTACLAGHIIWDDVEQRGNILAWTSKRTPISSYDYVCECAPDGTVVRSEVDVNADELASRIWMREYGFESTRKVSRLFYATDWTAEEVFTDEDAPTELKRAFERWQREHPKKDDSLR